MAVVGHRLLLNISDDRRTVSSRTSGIMRSSARMTMPTTTTTTANNDMDPANEDSVVIATASWTLSLPGRAPSRVGLTVAGGMEGCRRYSSASPSVLLLAKS